MSRNCDKAKSKQALHGFQLSPGVRRFSRFSFENGHVKRTGALFFVHLNFRFWRNEKESEGTPTSTVFDGFWKSSEAKIKDAHSWLCAGECSILAGNRERVANPIHRASLLGQSHPPANSRPGTPIHEIRQALKERLPKKDACSDIFSRQRRQRGRTVWISEFRSKYYNSRKCRRANPVGTLEWIVRSKATRWRYL